MKDIENLLKEGVEAAYELQARGDAGTAGVRHRILKRGRRRRVARLAASGVLSVALVAGAASAATSLWERDVEVAGRAVPELGAEAMFGGGPAATDGSSLWVGDGRFSNTAGDRNSVARMDLATGEVVNGEPAIELPQEMAVGESGLWTVAWSGDISSMAESGDASGVVERVDPVTLERTARLERPGWAPYDVAIGRVGGREVVWVVDTAGDQLIAIDGRTTDVIETHPMPHRPVTVGIHGAYVYVTSSKEHIVVRLDPATGERLEIAVPDCANEVTVAYGSLWVTDYCGDALLRLDESGSGDAVTIDVGAGPSSVAAAEGLVWVSTEAGVVRVDPETDAVVGERVYVTEFFMGRLLYAGGDMWTHGSDGVYRLREDVPASTPPPSEPPTPDPRALPVPAGVERIDVERDPRSVAAGEDWVWTGGWDVQRFGSATGERAGKTELESFVIGLRVDEDAGLLWALLEDQEQGIAAVVAIDPDTDEVVVGPANVEPSNVSGQHFDAAGGVAWVGGRGGTLSRVDGATGEVTETDLSEHFDEMFNDEGSFKVAASGEAVLVLATDGTVVRVDVASGKHSKVENIGHNVADVEYDGANVWVAQQATKGGNLLSTLDASTGKRTGEPIEVSEYGFVLMSEHDGTVWAVQGGVGEGLLVKAYEDGEVVDEWKLPGAQYTTDVDAGPSGLWVTTGQDFLYRIAAP